MLMTNKGRLARLHYLPGTFRVLTPGDHVLCAVTRQPIPLDELRYWSVERQEAYASAEASVKAEGRADLAGPPRKRSCSPGPRRPGRRAGPRPRRSCSRR